MEIRLHGRGGQGGVTAAKILASIYAHQGLHVQAFGDYAGERSGAPVRAYARVSDRPISNRNKVYAPHQLLVLDPSLLGPATVAGLAPAGLLLVNTPATADALALLYPAFTVATVDATAIARDHGIGSRAVVIVNTTLAGAYARAAGVSLEAVERAFASLGFGPENLQAARAAHGAVQIRRPVGSAAGTGAGAGSARERRAGPGVLDLVQHAEGPHPQLKTGDWRSSAPRYVRNLAPCNAACPAGNDVVAFIGALARGETARAAEILAASTPFPGVCGRVCPAPCMLGCNRISLDGAVNVRALERWVSDHHQPSLRPDPHPAPKKIAVVGGGPAGLSAAWQLARRGHQVTIYDAEAELGGVLRTGIPPYRLPREVLDHEISQVLALGVRHRPGVALDGPGLESLESRHDAVLLTTGLQNEQGLRLPGADLPGVEQGLHFLRQVNTSRRRQRGHVVVLGGGNTAMDCARAALRVGATKVTVAYRRTRAEMPAIPEEVQEALDEGVQLAELRSPLRFLGSDRVEAVELGVVELGEPDAGGRRRPVLTDASERLACDAVLLALGQGADHSLLPAQWAVEGQRVIGPSGPRMVFLAGDVATTEGTVVHAIGDGHRVALRALQALGEALPPFVRPSGQPVGPAEIRAHHFPPHPPVPIEHLPPASRARSMDEVNLGPVDVSEAARCLSCGSCTLCDTCLVVCPEGVIDRRYEDGAHIGYNVDLDYCKGCGLCAVECPRSGLDMNHGAPTEPGTKP